MAEFSDPVTCEWFALCSRPAVGDAPHPVLGMVPVCADCANRFDLPLITFQNQE